jgi:hypothetical protein
LRGSVADRRHAPGPGDIGRPWADEGRDQALGGAGGAASPPPDLAARTVTSAATSSGVGSPRTICRNGRAGSVDSDVTAPPSLPTTAPPSLPLTAECSRASWAAGSPAWYAGVAAP